MSAVRTRSSLSTYALRLGDDALILAQRLGEWITRAPQIEEDIALGNIALDLLGQARALLSYAGELDDAGRSEDDLAFLRDERDFVNLQIVERPNEDFAVTMARQLLFSTYQRGLYERLQSSADQTLAGVAAKAVKEVDYHRDHATQWVIRLGDGTPLSHERMQAGLDRMWPFVEEMFLSDDLETALVRKGVAVESSSLWVEWETYLDAVLIEANLTRPTSTWTAAGGRAGLHTEEFGYLLAQMQHLHRSHPGASW